MSKKMRLLIDGKEIPKEEINVDAENGPLGVFILSTKDYEIKLPMWLLRRTTHTRIKTPKHKIEFIPR